MTKTNIRQPRYVGFESLAGKTYPHFCNIPRVNFCIRFIVIHLHKTSILLPAPIVTHSSAIVIDVYSIVFVLTVATRIAVTQNVHYECPQKLTMSSAMGFIIKTSTPDSNPKDGKRRLVLMK